MNRSFGNDFSDVKIHVDSDAVQMNQNLGAKAFAHGNDIYFNEGKYSPNSSEGKGLLAHELTHTIQQKNSFSNRIQRDLKPDEPASKYLPNWAEHPSKMTRLSESERKQKIIYYKKLVLISWEKLKALRLSELLMDATNISKNEMSEGTPLQGLSESVPEKFGYLLKINNPKVPGNTEYVTSIGFSLITGTPVIDGDKTNMVTYTVENMAKSGPLTSDAIKSLRGLDDVFKRVLIAHEVAEKANVSIQEVLAIYRREGNLNVPPSHSEISKGIPSGENNAPTKMENIDTTNNVVLLNKVSIDSFGWNVEKIKEYALMTLTVQIGGLDQIGFLATKFKLDAFGNYEYESNGDKKREFDNSKFMNIANLFAKWSNTNWKLAGFDHDTKADAKLRWEEIVKNLKLSVRDGSSSKAYLIAPKNAQKFVTDIMLEVSILHKSYSNPDIIAKKLDKSFSKKWSPATSYMIYHKGTPEAPKVFRSALRAAAKCKSTDRLFMKLKSETSKIKNINSWESIQKWLNDDPERFDLLINFVENAGDKDWAESGGWPAFRKSARWIKTLNMYYGKVFDYSKLVWKDGLKVWNQLIKEHQTNYYNLGELDYQVQQWKSENQELKEFKFEIIEQKETFNIKINHIDHLEREDKNTILNKTPIPPTALFNKIGTNGIIAKYVTRNIPIEGVAKDSNKYFPGMELTLTTSDANSWGVINPLPLKIEGGEVSEESFLLVPNVKEFSELYQQSLSENLNKFYSSKTNSENLVWIKATHNSFEKKDTNGILKGIKVELGKMIFDGTEWKTGVPEMVLFEQNYELDKLGLFEKKLNVNEIDLTEFTKLGISEDFSQLIITVRDKKKKKFKNIEKFNKKMEGRIRKIIKSEPEIGKDFSSMLSLMNNLFKKNIIEIK